MIQNLRIKYKNLRTEDEIPIKKKKKVNEVDVVDPASLVDTEFTQDGMA